MWSDCIGGGGVILNFVSGSEFRVEEQLYLHDKCFESRFDFVYQYVKRYSISAIDFLASAAKLIYSEISFSD